MFDLFNTGLLSQILVLFVFFGCAKNDDLASNSQSSSPPKVRVTIQNAGSDTMVNLAQAWAEAYVAIDPEISVEVSGGGSGTGIAALINGTVDIANCSRSMKPTEIEKAVQNTGREPKQLIVGFDALAVYVHKENPLEKISLQQLADIYGEQGQTATWSKLGIQYTACKSDEIIRVSRQSNSGTYVYFREAVLGKTGDFKLGSRDLHGSKDVVELVANTPCAIGYSGMGYATDHVKMLKISKKDGEQSTGPSAENTLNGTYPIARPLYIYSLGEPSRDVKKYLDWILSETGQSIVTKNGYVPVQTK
ncbi:phosphate-binding protein [Candidatus Poribacteria bacterium]|nr:phosphate-binding protein [Candidatus Poribacteria bacterium]